MVFRRVYETGEPAFAFVPRLDGYEARELTHPPRDRWAGVVYPFVPADPRTLSFDPLTRTFVPNSTVTLLRSFLLSNHMHGFLVLMRVAFQRGISRGELGRLLSGACLLSLFTRNLSDVWEPHMLAPWVVSFFEHVLAHVPPSSRTTSAFILALQQLATQAPADPALDWIRPAPTPTSTPLVLTLPPAIRRTHDLHQARQPTSTIHVCMLHPLEAANATIRLYDGARFCPRPCGLPTLAIDLRGRLVWCGPFAWTLCGICGKPLMTTNGCATSHEAEAGWCCTTCLNLRSS